MLSNRVRPDVEAAPWVIEEIKKLERDAARYRFWRDRYPVTFAPTDMTPEDVDRATDKAMEATNGQGD